MFSNDRLPWHLLLIATLTHQTTGYVIDSIPKPTTTLPYRELAVQLWPLVPTDAPSLLDPLARRQLDTICGYIGGDPDLPATCSAGSHCAVDVDHGVLGCCPDGGACTAGVFTGCVDSNSGPQTEVDPYVYTCKGRDVCYQNHFEGGYSQFGCGSASSLATTVDMQASGKPSLTLSSISASLTDKPSMISTSSRATKPTSITASRSTSASTSGSSTTEAASYQTNQSTNAPDAGSGSGNHTGAIIGGTIGGMAALAALVVLGLFCFRRRQRNARRGPGVIQETKYISPMADRNHFEPLTSIQEESEAHPLPQGPPAVFSGGTPSYDEDAMGDGQHIPRTRTNDSYGHGYGPGSGSTVGGGWSGYTQSMQSDEVPLHPNFAGHDAFSRQTLTPTSSQEDFEAGPYPGRRQRGEGSALWSQNRRDRGRP